MKEQETYNELQETAQGIFDTFVHRRDAYTVQTDDGRYFASYNEITPQHIMGHLKGDITIGVYLLGEDETASYTVIDADDEGGLQRLLWVREMLGLPSYLESSRRGGHLWFFFEEPVSGKVAKNFGLEVAKTYMIEAEVFPKQAKSDGPGSSIRLPFGIHRKTGKRYPFLGLGNWREQLDALMHPKKVALEDVMRYQYREPERKPKGLPETDIPVASSGDLPLWERVKREISVIELVEPYVDLNDSGAGLCPFHDDNNPSFSVNDEENYWNCFAGCGGGSVIDFWMNLHDMEFSEAVRDLAERLGVK